MNCKILLCANTNREHYVDAIRQLGSTATVSYLDHPSTDYDGLILCGGNDMDPAFYGQELDGSVKIDRPRDDAEWAYLQEFLKTGKPIMGICRGFQLLNVFFGGDLHQHLESTPIHRGSLDHYPVHEVTAVKDSFLSDLYGERFSVNSCHHQGIRRLAEDLVPLAYADDLVEAFSHKTLPLFGVQWHPEKCAFANLRPDAADGAPLFRYFLRLCEEGRKRS